MGSTCEASARLLINETVEMMRTRVRQCLYIQRTNAPYIQRAAAHQRNTKDDAHTGAAMIDN